MFAWRAASPQFFKLFWAFFGQKTMKKSSCSCTSCWCFPPLKNHAFYRLPCMGTVFLEICRNREKQAKKRGKTRKNRSFDSITKIAPERPSRASKIDPKSPNFGEKIAKNCQNGGKKRVFEASIFQAKKRSEKRSKKEPHGVNLTSRGNGKRKGESDAIMLPSAATCGN